MLRSLKDLEGYGLHATDGELGKIRDFLFDDVAWTVRYAVVDTRRWLPGRRVLISPAAFREPDWASSLIPLDLSKEQVRSAPAAEEDRPVSRQHEEELARHFSWPTYWVPPHAGAEAPGVLPRPEIAGTTARPTPDPTPRPEAPTATVPGDPHLRSADEVVGYKVHALDGDVGSVDDFVVDTASWNLRYLVADTRKWLPGGKVLLSPDWIERVRWDDSSVHVDLKRDMIKACPPYKPSQAVNREYEERLYDYYGRPHYWA